MKTKYFKVLGLDISKDNATAHLLAGYPQGGIKADFSQKIKNAPAHFPKFYAHPKKARKDSSQAQKGCYDFLDYLREHRPNVVILEPTGTHYSRLWRQLIEAVDIPILWVGHLELKRYRYGKGLKKTDPSDALALAAYYYDPEHWTSEEELNLKYFLRPIPPIMDELREICQQLEHLNRVQSPVINYLRQRLIWEFPEQWKGVSINFFWWLSGQYEKMNQSQLTIFNNKYKKSIAYQLGTEISPIVRHHARILSNLMEEERRLEDEIHSILLMDEFKEYREVFNRFNFGLRTQAKLLTRIYPFDMFLHQGKELISHEYREVQRTEKNFKNGGIEVSFLPGQTKRIKKNKSRDSFKLRLGMGSVFEKSGDKTVEVSSGSSLTRKALYQYVFTTLEQRRFPNNPIGEKLEQKYDQLKAEKLKGRHRQGKLMARVINLLYAELKRIFIF